MSFFNDQAEFLSLYLQLSASNRRSPPKKRNFSNSSLSRPPTKVCTSLEKLFGKQIKALADCVACLAITSIFLMITGLVTIERQSLILLAKISLEQCCFQGCCLAIPTSSGVVNFSLESTFCLLPQFTCTILHLLPCRKKAWNCCMFDLAVTDHHSKSNLTMPNHAWFMLLRCNCHWLD